MACPQIVVLLSTLKCVSLLFCQKSGTKVQQKNDICKRKAGKIHSVAIFTHFLNWDQHKSLIKVLQKSYLGLTGFWQAFSAVDVEKLTEFVKNAKNIKISLRMCVKCSTFAADFAK